MGSRKDVLIHVGLLSKTPSGLVPGEPLVGHFPSFLQKARLRMYHLPVSLQAPQPFASFLSCSLSALHLWARRLCLCASSQADSEPQPWSLCKIRGLTESRTGGKHVGNHKCTRFCSTARILLLPPSLSADLWSPAPQTVRGWGRHLLCAET